MSAVLGIVRSHRGTLHVRSTPGRGTRFEVCLPSTGQPSARPVSEARAAPPTPRGKILVIDDDPGICALVRTILTRDGWESEEHLDPRSVVAMTATHLAGFSAVILDVTMPEIDGYEVLRAIRTLCPGLPVMIVSGRSAGELEGLIAASGAGAGSGADATMQKPFEAHSLSEAISRLTQTRRG